MFFESDEVLNAIDAFLNKSASSNMDDPVRQRRLELSRKIIGYIRKSPEEWDKRCSFNVEHVGSQFLHMILEFDQSDWRGIDEIYGMAYRFLCEFDFFVGHGQQLSMQLRSIKNEIENDSAEMSDIMRSQMVYASLFMPANIVKDFINDPSVNRFKDFEEKIEEAEKLKESWTSDLVERQNQVQELKKKLDEYKTGFNFVGLYQGFDDLDVKKKRESLVLFLSMIFMGLAIITPLVFEFYSLRFGESKTNYFTYDNLMVLLPLASLEFILIYYFRIMLINFRAVKAQIMQIELRKTLCQFIQSYAEYSSKIKKEDEVALDKFENLIFSSIVSDPEKLPSTYDGIGQIVDLIKNIKN